MEPDKNPKQIGNEINEQWSQEGSLTAKKEKKWGMACRYANDIG